MRETVIIDITEVKANFWDRLRKVSSKDETTIKDLLIEIRNQIIVMEDLVNAQRDE